jgi:hypothetical protein
MGWNFVWRHSPNFQFVLCNNAAPDLTPAKTRQEKQANAQEQTDSVRLSERIHHIPFPLRLPFSSMKGRGLNAPFLEAPLSACPDSTPSRAERLAVSGRAWKISGFLGSPVAKSYIFFLS